MRFSEGTGGRVFGIRLEDGDALPASVEEVAKERGVARGMCVLVGGIAGGGKIVVGPEDGDRSPVVPVLAALAGVHEIAGVGLVFPDEEGIPRLHMHAALGRGSETLNGVHTPGDRGLDGGGGRASRDMRNRSLPKEGRGNRVRASGAHGSTIPMKTGYV